MSDAPDLILRGGPVVTIDDTNPRADPLAVPPEHLRDIGIEATYVGGRPVFER